VFLCGGGAKNSALVERLSALMGDRRVDTTAPLGVHPDWVEACAFAWLAHQALTMRPGNLPSVTGAAKPVILGGIYPGNQNHAEGSA
jgi:anhydro-N-acetylmuramic acid kinase